MRSKYVAVMGTAGRIDPALARLVLGSIADPPLREAHAPQSA
jgi:hypothetical protein